MRREREIGNEGEEKRQRREEEETERGKKTKGKGEMGKSMRDAGRRKESGGM